jgi:hypothetical protein
MRGMKLKQLRHSHHSLPQFIAIFFQWASSRRARKPLLKWLGWQGFLR